MTKIVIDTGISNFVLSKQAVLMLYELGSDMVSVSGATCFHGSVISNLAELSDVVSVHGNAAIHNGSLLVFGDGSNPPIQNAQRADALLVKVVETLGDAASGCTGAHIEVIEIPDGVQWEISLRSNKSEYVSENECAMNDIRRTWSEVSRMPKLYNDCPMSYVLESDLPAWEKPYFQAVNFLAACPVPKSIKPNDHAFYAHDYMRWYEWRMVWGDYWRERAKTKYWYERYKQICNQNAD